MTPNHLVIIGGTKSAQAYRQVLPGFTPVPTIAPSANPSPQPSSANPSPQPSSANPSPQPSVISSPSTFSPTALINPSLSPTYQSSFKPTITPSINPTKTPSYRPSYKPSISPTTYKSPTTATIRKKPRMYMLCQPSQDGGKTTVCEWTKGYM